MRKFVTKCILYCVLAYLIQLFVLSLFPIATNSFPELEQLNDFLRNNTDIIYFGSSVDWWSPSSDEDKRKISEILDDLQPSLKIHGISHGSYHMELFYYFAKYMVRAKSYPKLIIFEINLRSFSPEWHMRPQYQFEQEKIILNGGLTNGIYSILSAFNYRYYKYSDLDFFRTPVYFENQKIGTVKDFIESDDNFQQYDTDTKIQKKNIFYYLYQLTEQHPKIQAMRDLIALCSHNKVDILFFITPIDFLYGEKYVPGKFDVITERNIRIITSTLEGENAAYLDLSKSLESSFFSHGMYPDEHLHQKGRCFVAESLSDYINNKYY